MEKERTRTTIRRISAVLFAVLAVVMVIYLSILWNTENITVTGTRTGSGISRVEDFDRQVIDDETAPAGCVTEYSFVLEDTKQYDVCLAFYTIHQFVTVYIDDEMVYKMEPSPELKTVKTPGTNWTLIPLHPEDEGKEIHVYLTPAYKNFVDAEVEFLVGPEDDIIVNSLHNSVATLMISGLAVLLGILLFSLSIYLMIKDKKMNEIFPLGIFSLLLGLWRLADTGFSPFLDANRPVMMFYLSVLSLMVGIIPFAKVQKARTRLWTTDFYCLVAAVLSIVIIIADLAGVIELREYLNIIHVVLFTGIILVGYNLLRPNKANESKPGDSIERLALFIFIGGVVLDAIAFYVTGTSAGLLFTLLAFLIAILVKGISFVYVYLGYEKMLIRREKQLINSRAAVMMGQIRSHFVFNILNAISGMCKYDPEKADETIVRFSKYLRANVDLMHNDEPVHFSQVITRLEDYIILEQVRFGDKISFEEELEVIDFKLPDLILQPIVENAIKHGIQPKESQGTITLKTYEDAENVYIKIIDDGVGFDTSKAAREGSAGMKNVRFRLDYFMNGKMETSSVPGKGTVVTLTLPRKEAAL